MILAAQNDYGFTKPYSDVTAQIIDQEISNIIETQYQRAINLLKKHKNKLVELADVLLAKEVIFKEDLVRIYGERPFDIKKVIKDSKSLVLSIIINISHVNNKFFYLYSLNFGIEKIY